MKNKKRQKTRRTSQLESRSRAKLSASLPNSKARSLISKTRRSESWSRANLCRWTGSFLVAPRTACRRNSRLQVRTSSTFGRNNGQLEQIPRKTSIRTFLEASPRLSPLCPRLLTRHSLEARIPQLQARLSRLEWPHSIQHASTHSTRCTSNCFKRKAPSDNHRAQATMQMMLQQVQPRIEAARLAASPVPTLADRPSPRSMKASFAA